MKTQKGFTLIELIVVIVILGILSAIALPKFVNIGGDARAAVMKGVAGSMAGANAMIYAKAANTVNGFGNAVNVVNVNGATINTTSFGFATTVTALQPILDLNPLADFTVAAGSIQHAKAATPATCSVTYTAATSVNVPPTYVVNTAGC